MKKFVVLMIALFTVSLAKAGWENTNFPGPASDGYSGFVIGTKAYIGLGLGSSGFWSFDTQTQQWKTLPNPACGKRAWAIGFAINGKGYIGGGDPDGNFKPTKEFWQYDPTNGSWTPVANFGGGVRDGATAFVLNGRAYVVGGFDGTNVLSEVWQYDPVQDKWAQLPDFPGGPIIFGASFVIDNKAYVCTGASNVEQTYCYEFDPSTQEWTSKANFPGVPRQTAVGFSMNGKGYIGLGEAGYTTSFNDFYEYNPLNNKWQSKPAMDFPNYSTGWSFAFSIDDVAYVGTGTKLPTFEYSNIIYSYDNVTTPVESKIGVSVNELNFDSVQVGKSKTLSFDITNTGTKELTIQSASLKPAVQTEFTSDIITQINTGSIKIAVGAKKTFNVSYTPAGAAEIDGTLEINSDATNLPKVQIALYGTGWVKAEPKLEASVSELDFGEVEVMKSDSLTFMISNTGNITLNNVLINIVNDDGNNFKLLSYNTKFTAIQGQHYTPEISFNPATQGDKTALLRVTADEFSEPLLELPLKGKGIPSTGVNDSIDDNNIFSIKTSPNPATENLNIVVTSKLSNNQNCRVSIYSTNGEIIKEIYNGMLNIGENAINANTSRYVPGLYYVEAEINGKVSRQKIVIVR